MRRCLALPLLLLLGCDGAGNSASDGGRSGGTCRTQVDTPTNGVACPAEGGTQTCTGSTPVCCFDHGICVADVAACNQIFEYAPVTCDEAADCLCGQVCCGSSYRPGFIGASCTSDCGSTPSPRAFFVLCGDAGNTCEAGQSCQPAAELHPYSWCE